MSLPIRNRKKRSKVLCPLCNTNKMLQKSKSCRPCLTQLSLNSICEECGVRGNRRRFEGKVLCVKCYAIQKTARWSAMRKVNPVLCAECGELNTRGSICLNCYLANKEEVKCDDCGQPSKFSVCAVCQRAKQPKITCAQCKRIEVLCHHRLENGEGLCASCHVRPFHECCDCHVVGPAKHTERIDNIIRYWCDKCYRPCKCEQCGLRTFSATSLSLHQRRHSDWAGVPYAEEIVFKMLISLGFVQGSPQSRKDPEPPKLREFYYNSRPFLDLVGLQGRPLEADFLITFGPDDIQWLELNGEAHYQEVPYFHQARSLEDRQEHDRRRRVFATSTPPWRGLHFLEWDTRADLNSLEEYVRSRATGS